ncbi:ParB N-terminal domain-containing protein [Fictibacillus sp. S7]|uniref:ParB N-terminal domain-containing protein n=1 Tax=Fictibacillus sp. S7 TaxID=2212476 RepID=UPI0013E96256|nr:ParB N-terminal domain-containing protein [Fictibacillus sp. S7]
MSIVSSLKLINPDNVLLHEPYEPARLRKIIDSIRNENVLRNPLIGLQLNQSEYLILDGAHRISALKQMGCYRVPIQIINPSDILIQAWDHVLPIGAWIETLYKHPEIEITTKSNDQEPLAEFLKEDGSYTYIYPKKNHKDSSTRVQLWHEVVGTYTNHFSVMRIPQSSKEKLQQNMIRFRYPTCSLQFIKEVVTSGEVLPAGVTRFSVNGRLLNLRIPLSFLMSQSISENQWEEACTNWNNNLRLYPEEVYLFEA